MRVRVLAALSAGLVGGGLMCGVAYTHGTSLVLGALAGALLVGTLGYGVAGGLMSTLSLGAVLFALFFGMIGPGCDDYGGNAIPPALLAGGFVGWLCRGRRRHDAAPRLLTGNRESPESPDTEKSAIHQASGSE